MLIKSKTYQRKQERYSERGLFEDKTERYFTIDGVWYCYKCRSLMGQTNRFTLTLEEVVTLPKFVVLEASDDRNTLKCEIVNEFDLAFGSLTSVPLFVTETRLSKAYDKYVKESSTVVADPLTTECKQISEAFEIPFEIVFHFQGNLARSMQFHNALNRAKSELMKSTKESKETLSEILSKYNVPTFNTDLGSVSNFVSEYLAA